MASEENSTLSWNSACVPMTMGAWPSRMPSSSGAARLAGLPSAQAAPRRCRAVRTSAGNSARADRPAIRWAPSARPGGPSEWPESRRAPQPASCRSPRRPAPGATSAWSAPDRVRSRAARAAAPRVMRNGNAASKLAFSVPARSAAASPGSLCMRRRSSLSDSWCASNSSNARRRCAGCRQLSSKSTGASAGGRCTYSNASRSEGRRESASIAGGSQSVGSCRAGLIERHADEQAQAALGHALRWRDRSA